MVENLTFHFEGALADSHRMNFYEAARFQYAASRLMVKLAQFRSKGKFVKKISSKSNFNIQLLSQTDGSYNVNVEDSGQPDDSEEFIRIPLSDMIAYVTERIIEKLDGNALAAQLPGVDLLSPPDGDTEGAQQALIDQAISIFLNDTALFASLPLETKELIKRRLAEAQRETRMIENQSAISKIDFASGQKLIAMAAPLLSEMAQVSLRRSASTLEIRSSVGGDSKTLVFLNQRMARDIETAIVDLEITPILGDVIQFNKDNGWGKVKIESGLRTVSFSIPYDKLPELKQTLIDNMKKDLVYLQTNFVRDRSNELIRLVVVGILPAPAF